MSNCIKIVDQTGASVCSMSDAWARNADAVKYDGKYYRTVKKFESEYTNGGYNSGYFPVINLNSGTIRGIKGDQLVEVVKLEILVKKSHEQS